MAQASIHFEPVKGGSEEHNKRLKFLDYVHPERTHLNEYWESDTQANRLAAITQNFLEHHPKRKKLHAKATPIREAVVNITEATTMEDLKKLAKRLHDRFGIEIFQIAIHKDEGYFNSPDGEKLNLHAHLVADWTNHELGESLKLSRQDMAEMQTINAECLNMQRGVSSDKKHLTAMQYKEQKAKEEAEKAEREKQRIEGITNTLAKAGKKRLDEIAELKQEKEKTAKEVEKMRSEAVELQTSNNSLSETKKALRSEISGLIGIKASLDDDIDEKITQLNEKQSEAEKAIKAKEEAEKDIKSLRNFESDLNMQLDVVTGEVVKQEQWRDSLKEEVETLTQERDKAKRETAAARESLQNLTANRDRVQNWKWGFNELIKLIKPILDAIKRFAHVDGRGARFTPEEVVLIDFALGRDDKREERAARYTRWAEDEEEHPRLYGGYRYQCAGEHMKMIAENAAVYYNSVSQSQGRGMGY